MLLPLAILAGTTTAVDQSNPLVSYGLLGIILMAFTYLILSGRLVSGKEHDRVIAEKAELQRNVPDAIAALTVSAETTKEVTVVMRDVLRTLGTLDHGHGP